MCTVSSGYGHIIYLHPSTSIPRNARTLLRCVVELVLLAVGDEGGEMFVLLLDGQGPKAGGEVERAQFLLVEV